MGCMPRIFVLILALTCEAAWAQSHVFTYSDTDLAKCTPGREAAFGPTFHCSGLDDTKVLIGVGDHKTFVSYGERPEEEFVWTQSVPGTNRIGAKIEWISKDGEPVASILRYYIDRSAADLPEKQMLVVAKISPGNTCHVAYIDALTIENANSLARAVALDLVPHWNCKVMKARSYS